MNKSNNLSLKLSKGVTVDTARLTVSEDLQGQSRILTSVSITMLYILVFNLFYCI